MLELGRCCAYMVWGLGSKSKSKFGLLECEAWCEKGLRSGFTRCST